MNAVKRCRNCGREYPLTAKLCEKCGDELYVSGEPDESRAAPVTEQVSIKLWMYILGFLIPIAGAIVGVTMISEYNPSSTRAGKALIVYSLIMIPAAPLLIWLGMTIVNVFIF